MGHGTPDWWGTEPGETTFKVSDLGELAARLVSIDTFDRRGNVIWLSGFESGLGEFYTVTGGTGASVVLSTATAQMGAYSCKLTAGSDGDKMAGLLKALAYPVLGRFGGEGAFVWNTGITNIIVEFDLYDGTNYTVWAIKFDRALGKIYYYNSLGGWVEVGALPAWGTATYLFHIAKLVVDLENKKYAYLIVDNTGYSLAGIGARSVASAVQPHLIFTVLLTGPGATNPSIYVDNMIITQNEP